MKIKLDENLPVSLSTVLHNLAHDVHTVTQEHLSSRSDRDIWEAAQSERRFLITQDLDFSDLRRFAPGTHCGLLLVRLRSPDRQTLLHRVPQMFPHEDVNGWARCFVVATDRKIQVIRPPG